MEGGADGTTDVEGTVEVEISEEEDSIGAEEGIRSGGSEVTLVGAAIGTGQPSLDSDKGEQTVDKGAETTDKGEIEEPGKSVDIQRSKEGLTEEIWTEKSDGDVGRIGKSDS